MNTKSQLLLLFLSITISLLSSCMGKKDPKGDITQLVDKYNGFILEMNADSLAEMFLEGGEIGEEGYPSTVGKDKIRSMLKSFPNVKVLENKTIIDSFQMKEEEVMVFGRFEQKALINQQEKFEGRGEIFFNFVKDNNSHWKIKSLTTKTKK